MLETGLSLAEVEQRRKEYGANEVPAERDAPVVRFLGKFWGPSAWMLELILLLSAFLGKYSELALVGALLVTNALLSYLQEQRAFKVVEALRKQLQLSARVLRDSLWTLIPARDLVPGDVLRVRTGDIVPADATLLDGALGVDESALTGESAQADKAPGDVLRSGSVVRTGEGNAKVVLTGTRTQFGRTAELVQKARPARHFEAVVAKVVRRLIVIVGALVTVVVVLSLFRGTSLLEMLPLMLILMMSAVPLALPVIFTVSTALGSKELAKLGVIVTRLSAAEDAATMDTLCVDKTGTITLNRLAVTSVIPWKTASEADVLFAGAVASQESNQDPLDRAFLEEARARGLPELPRDAVFAPFNADTRHTEAVVDRFGQRWRAMKGAVRTIAQMCALGAPQIAELESHVDEAALKGNRTLAVARGLEDAPPEFLGLVTLCDPPRADASVLITKLRGLGIAVKMLTGDALPVAQHIAAEVGLPHIRPAAELRATLAAATVADPWADIDGFAEVFPEDKYLVVKGLQQAGHVVGMTGDGVNDAPALRQAEVGIAVDTAADIAKGAASVVLTEPGLARIVILVEQGRAIYQRILTWVINKISRTILKAAVVAIAFVVTGRFVVSSFAMLLLVFLTDFAKVALATDRVRPSVKPETWEIGGFVTVSVVLGLIMVAETLLLLWWGWERFALGSHEGLLSTFSFLALLYFAVFSVVSARERRWFWSSFPSGTLVAALTANALVGTALTLIRIPGLPPLPWELTGGIFGYSLVACLGINDAVKVLLIRRLVHPSASKPDTTSKSSSSIPPCLSR